MPGQAPDFLQGQAKHSDDPLGSRAHGAAMVVVQPALGALGLWFSLPAPVPREGILGSSLGGEG